MTCEEMVMIKNSMKDYKVPDVSSDKTDVNSFPRRFNVTIYLFSVLLLLVSTEKVVYNVVVHPDEE